MIWKQFRYNFMVLLNGPVRNALFCLMDRHQNVCVWFIARNCRFPKVGTLCCQRGNHRLPLQGTPGSQRMELLVPNLGTRGYHCKQLPVPRGWNSRFPTWEAQVTIARNCQFPEVGTLGSQPGNHGLPLQATVKWYENIFVTTLWFCLIDWYRTLGFAYWTGTGMFAFGSWQGIAGSQTGYHCKELPVPRGWNSLFPTWEPEVTISSNCRFPEVGTLGIQPGNHRLPLQGTAGPKRLGLLVPNLGTMGYHCKQLLKWYENIFVTILWFCLMDRYRTLGLA